MDIKDKSTASYPIFEQILESKTDNNRIARLTYLKN